MSSDVFIENMVKYRVLDYTVDIIIISVSAVGRCQNISHLDTSVKLCMLLYNIMNFTKKPGHKHFMYFLVHGGPKNTSSFCDHLKAQYSTPDAFLLAGNHRKAFIK